MVMAWLNFSLGIPRCWTTCRIASIVSKVESRSPNRVRLRSATDNFTVRLDFSSEPNVWLLTAFERRNQRTERSSARLGDLWAGSTPPAPLVCDEGSAEELAAWAKGKGEGARVDPRGCGGAIAWLNFTTSGSGRSPRMRGSPRGIIENHVSLGVDPRGCGGAVAGMSQGCGWALGRSPRMRGSPETPSRSPTALESIPADAGEPSTRSPRKRRTWVDPRGCGGSPGRRGVSARASGGRSPRMRGSPVLGDSP